MSVAAVRRVVSRLAPDRPPTDAELVLAIAPGCSARRRRREMAATLSANTDQASRERERPEASLDRAELRAVIDDELAALPDAQRAAVVLCDLHGKTRAEAAAELDRPEGTVATWLS